MADKSFGIRQLNLIGPSQGIPTIESPSTLNLKAVNVAISTNLTVSGSVGIATTSPTSALTVSGDGLFSGIITASSFSGSGLGLTNIPAGQLTGSLPAIDGSALTGIVGSGGVVIQDDGSPIGTAGTINFGSNVSISFASGIATVSGASSVSAATTAYSIAGSPSANFGNINVGIITSGLIQATHNDAPIQTTNTTSTSQNSGLARFFAPNLDAGAFNAISFGKNNNLWETALLGFYWDGNSNNNTDSFVFLNLAGRSSTLVVHGNDNIGIGSIKPTSKLDVVGSGKFTGVVTATTFYGNLVGSITDAINLTGGYANASQLNVSGVTTISQGRIQVDASSNLRFGNIAAGSGSVGRNIAIGDQVLVSLSGGQGRNIGIGELSYNETTSGQYNVGVGIRAGQKITTGSYNVILGGFDGQTGLDIRTSSNNVVISDGDGNIRQYINSLGNVGIKTTVVTEALTVAGVVSATSFYGTLNANQLTGKLPAIDGSSLFGVVATGTGVEVRDDGNVVGTAGTIDFGTNLNVSFASGIATITSSIAGISTSGTSTFNRLNVTGISTFQDVVNINPPNATAQLNLGNGKLQITHNGSTGIIQESAGLTGLYLQSDDAIHIKDSTGGKSRIRTDKNGSVDLYYNGSKTFATVSAGATITGTTFTNQLSVSSSANIFGGANVSGIITASSFSGSASGLTNIPAGQLTGTLPAIDGSALINLPAQPGDGINVSDDNSPVGSARTVNFGTGLDVSISGGIATITASGGSLQSRTTVTGTTASLTDNEIGNINITGFKSYALMKVGLSTAGWLRLYTDSASRTADVSRSVGEDPAPGSGVIAEVVTTGISTTQIISPFVMGGNLDNPADTTIYAAITNLSGSTQTITANLTILQLEA